MTTREEYEKRIAHIKSIFPALKADTDVVEAYVEGLMNSLEDWKVHYYNLNTARQKDADLAATYYKKYNELKARIEGSPKVWLLYNEAKAITGVVYHNADRQPSNSEDHELVHAVPVLEEEKEAYEKLG